MDKVTKILQEKELELLKMVSDVLEENEIDYYLACGTALGCVRHKGFIPWDDDVDIYIRGKDYIRLREVFANLENDKIAFHDGVTVKNYPYPFPKFVLKNTILIEHSLKHFDYECGVYIDVFPLIESSNNVFIRKLSGYYRYILYAIHRAYYHEFNGVRKLANIFARIFVNPQSVYCKLVDRYTSVQESPMYYSDTGLFGKKSYISSEYFKSNIYMTFENLFLSMPVGYDGYLTDYYGDYSKMPSINERVSNHHIDKLIIDGEKII